MTTDSDSKEAAGRTWPGGHVLRLDLRSLALIRVVYGALLLVDTLSRWVDIVPFYTDRGLMPRRFLLELGEGPLFSLHMMSGSLIWANFLFAVQAAAAVAMLVGWRTRWATVLSYLLLYSVQGRNPMITDGGDCYLRVILFWLMFLPTGHRWSMDAKYGKGDHFDWMPTLTRNSLFGMSALAVLVQYCSIYWFAALPKTDPSWTVTYTATLQALHLDIFLTRIGLVFRDSMIDYLPILTYLVIWWEFWGPFFLFFPFDRGQVRVLGIFGFAALHAGFGSTLALGLFAWTGALTGLMFLPAWFWDVPMRRVGGWADERFGKGPEAQGDPGYGWPREILFFFLMIYCFAWNMGNEKQRPDWFRVPRRMNDLGVVLGLEQRWNMFSPSPLTEDGWYVIEGHFRDGRVLDLFRNGAEVSWEKPPYVARDYRGQRWRKYLLNIWLADNQGYRLPWGQYLCRKWNKGGRGSDELVNFDIVYMLEVTEPDGKERVPEKKVIWSHWCFEQPAEDEKTKND